MTDNSQYKHLESTIKTVNIIGVLAKGKTAFQTVKGLKSQIAKMFLVNYAVFLGVLFLLNGVIYYYLLNPWLESWFGATGWLSTLGSFILWSIQIVMGALFTLVALVFSISIMGVWYEHSVTIVIKHFRELPESSFSFSNWVKNIGKTIKQAFSDTKLLILLILLNFIPVVGTLIAFLFGAYLVGREMVSPYFIVTEMPEEEAINFKKSLRMTTFSMGSLQMFLAFIPILGWLLMPFLIIYQIVGLAYALEDAPSKP